MTMAQARQEAAQVLEQTAKAKRQARKDGLAFESLGEDEIVAKLVGYTSNSPFINSVGWTSGAPGGTNATIRVRFHNPSTDPHAYGLFVSVFFGTGANALDPGAFMAQAAQGNVELGGKWPYMNSPPLSVAPGAPGAADFSYKIPVGVPLTTYMGNVALWQGGVFDQGRYLDRANLYVTVL